MKNIRFDLDSSGIRDALDWTTHADAVAAPPTCCCHDFTAQFQLIILFVTTLLRAGRDVSGPLQNLSTRVH